MARVTRVFGVILVVLGGVYYFATGSTHPTALIPALFGFGLFVSAGWRAPRIRDGACCGCTSL